MHQMCNAQAFSVVPRTTSDAFRSGGMHMHNSRAELEKSSSEASLDAEAYALHPSGRNETRAQHAHSFFGGSGEE
jgi:hypothetical protein